MSRRWLLPVPALLASSLFLASVAHSGPPQYSTEQGCKVDQFGGKTVSEKDEWRQSAIRNCMTCIDYGGTWTIQGTTIICADMKHKDATTLDQCNKLPSSIPVQCEQCVRKGKKYIYKLSLNNNLCVDNTPPPAPIPASPPAPEGPVTWKPGGQILSQAVADARCPTTCAPGKWNGKYQVVNPISSKCGCIDPAPAATPAPAPASSPHSDGCTSTNQACTCSNTSRAGRCGIGPAKPGLYCRCD